MQVKKWNCLVATLFVLGLAGCSNEKNGPAEVPKESNRELPNVAAPAGGGAGPAKKASNPSSKAD